MVYSKRYRSPTDIFSEERSDKGPISTTIIMGRLSYREKFGGLQRYLCPTFGREYIVKIVPNIKC